MTPQRHTLPALAGDAASRRTARSAGGGRGGFTLVEILIALTVAVILIASSLHLYFHYRLAYLAQEQTNELHHNARTAQELIAYDMRMAGYGVPTPYSRMNQWVDWMPNITNIVVATQGSGSAPDTLSIVGVFDPPSAVLSAATARGATVLPVANADLVQFNTTHRKMIVIGGLETARVTGFASGGLVISVHPTRAGRGLRNRYPAGTPIEVVTVVTYGCNTAPTGYPNRPYLLRYNTPTQGTIANSLATIGIDSFQVQPATNGSWRVQIRGRAPTPALNYTDPNVGDAFRRYEVNSSFLPRNRRTS